MSLNNHIKALKIQHQELKRKIRIAYLSFKDDAEIQLLKKKKLLLKEKIQSFG
jgi:hypothetical protein